MRVLVTGHKGYIGSVLVPMLLERGHDVAGLDSDLFAECTFTGELARIPEHLGDVRDVPASVLAGFDAVIHLAGLSNDPLGDYDPVAHRRHQPRGRGADRQAGQAGGVPRFLFASSCSNYGASGDEFLDETARFNPVTPYGESKVNVELSVTPLADDDVQPDVPARVDRLRHVAADPVRPRGQQPRGLGLHHRRGLPEERRHPVAPDRARRGHLGRLHRRARGPARDGASRGLQRRLDDRELPDPRDRRDGPARSSPAARSPSPRTRRPTSAATAWTAT